MRRSISRRAFTLVEVMVAMTIFVIAFAGIFLAYGQSVRMLDALRQVSRAEDVMMANIEYLRTRSWEQFTNVVTTTSSSTVSWGSSNLIESVSANNTNSPVCSKLVLLSNDPLKIGLKNAVRNIQLTPQSDPNMMQATVSVVWETMNGRTLTNTMSTIIAKGGLSAFTLGSGTFAPFAGIASSASSSSSSTSASSSSTSASSSSTSASSSSTSASSSSTSASSSSTSASSSSTSASSSSTSASSSSTSASSSSTSASSSSTSASSSSTSASSSSTSASSSSSSTSSGSTGKGKFG